MWNKIRSISGKKRSSNFSYIRDTNGSIMNNPKEIAEAFCKMYSKDSSDENFPPEFIPIKEIEEAREYFPNSEFSQTDSPINEKISIEEIKFM